MSQLSTSPLIQELLLLDSQALSHAKTEHALWNVDELNGPADDQQIMQQHKNILFLDEFKKMNFVFEQSGQTKLTPLKGLSLLTKLYENNLGRPLTDMDVYTQLPESVFTPLLASLDYLPEREEKWEYNKHKYIFKKKHALVDLTCEVHTDLVPRSKPFTWNTDAEGNLSADEEFLYLCYHWGEQHTCLKLFWLLDLYYYLEKNPLDSQALWVKAEKLQMRSSLLAAHWALKNAFQVELLKTVPLSYGWKSFIFRKLLTPSTLIHIHQKRVIYLMLKHLLKDGFHKQLAYNVLWLRHQLTK